MVRSCWWRCGGDGNDGAKGSDGGVNSDDISTDGVDVSSDGGVYGVHGDDGGDGSCNDASVRYRDIET